MKQSSIHKNTQGNVHKNDLVHFATVGKPHGLTGAFFLVTQDKKPQNIEYSTVLLEFQDIITQKHVEKSYKSGGLSVLKLQGIDNRDDAQKFKNSKLYVTKETLAPSDDEILVADLIGCCVVCAYPSAQGLETGKLITIGTVLNVINFGAQENLEIKLINQKNSIYYPFINDFILKIDLENKTLEIKYIPEFLDDHK